MRNLVIRPATYKDVEAIRACHRKSIVEIAAKDYPPEIIAEWGTDNSAESVQSHRESIQSGAELCWVAICDNDVVGFCSLVPSQEELRAVYVIGEAARRGVGKALLETLESKAKELGLPRIKLDSSISARAFYERNGFKNLGQDLHKMPSGRQMVCFVMEKTWPPDSQKFN